MNDQYFASQIVAVSVSFDGLITCHAVMLGWRCVLNEPASQRPFLLAVLFNFLDGAVKVLPLVRCIKNIKHFFQIQIQTSFFAVIGFGIRKEP